MLQKVGEAGSTQGLLSGSATGWLVKSKRAGFAKILGTLGQFKTPSEFRVLREIQKEQAFFCFTLGSQVVGMSWENTVRPC